MRWCRTASFPIRLHRWAVYHTYSHRDHNATSAWKICDGKSNNRKQWKQCETIIGLKIVTFCLSTQSIWTKGECERRNCANQVPLLAFCLKSTQYAYFCEREYTSVHTWSVQSNTYRASRPAALQHNVKQFAHSPQRPFLVSSSLPDKTQFEVWYINSPKNIYVLWSRKLSSWRWR